METLLLRRLVKQAGQGAMALLGKRATMVAMHTPFAAHVKATTAKTAPMAATVVTVGWAALQPRSSTLARSAPSVWFSGKTILQPADKVALADLAA